MIELAKDDFETIRDIIRERSGIWISETRVNFLKYRLSTRLKANNMEVAKDYYYFLKYDPGGDKELENLIDEVTIKESYFFREQDQLQDFSQQIVPRLLTQKKEDTPIWIWSAGCSTGEEPYTLAMLLMEHPLKIEPSRINILAADISYSALRLAREGTYDDYSVRYVPPLTLLKYFDKNRDERYAVKDRVKEVVRFAHVNLVDPMSTSRMREMDCVFCRNVIIYFDDRDKKKSVEYMYRSLHRGGYLFLGHAESLSRVSSLFEVARLKKTVVYRKRENKV